MDIDALIDYATKQTIYYCRRFWTEEEKAFLRDNLGTMSMAQIAVALGRTENAVKVKQVRFRNEAPSKQTGYLTGHGCSKALGVDIHNVMKLNNRRLLPTDTIPGERGILRIKKITLYRWATRPKNWIYFRVHQMGDAHLKRLVELAQARWPDQWLTTGQAAALKGGDIIANDIERTILRGVIPGVKWGNWFVLRSDVLKTTFYKGRGGYCTPNYSTPRADAFLLRAKAEGKSFAAIGRMMKWKDKKVAYRYYYLTRSK